MPARSPRSLFLVAASAGALALSASGVARAATPTTTPTAPTTVATKTTTAPTSAVSPTPTTVRQAPTTSSVTSSSTPATTAKKVTGSSGAATGAPTTRVTTAAPATTVRRAPATTTAAARPAAATPTTLDPGTEALPPGAGPTPALLVDGDPSAPARGPGLLSSMTKLRLIGAALLLVGLTVLVLTVRFARRTRPDRAVAAGARSRAGARRPSRPAHAARTATRDMPRRTATTSMRRTSSAPAPAPAATPVARWRQPVPSADDDFERTQEQRVPVLR